MQKIIYDIHSKSDLIVGYSEENYAREIEFRGFEQKRSDTVIYLMVEEIGRFPLMGMRLPVEYSYTIKSRRYKAILLEKTADDTYVRKSNIFGFVVKHSVQIGDIVAPEIPEFRNWFDSMGILFNESKNLKDELIRMRDNGEFKGGPGKDGTSVGIEKITESTESGGINKVEFTDGKELEIRNGKDGPPGKKGDPGEIKYIENPYNDEPIKTKVREIKEDLSSQSERIKTLENEPKVPQSLIDDVETNKDKIEALWKLSEGTVYDFKTEESEAYSVDIPKGSKVADIQSVGGKSVVWNQLAKPNTTQGTVWGVLRTINEDGTSNFHGTVVGSPSYNQLSIQSNIETKFKRDGRKYLIRKNKKIDYPWGIDGYGRTSGNVNSYIFSETTGTDWSGGFHIQAYEGNVIDIDGIIINAFDLTTMFGAGNEPTVEQFEAMFPEEYYPYTEPVIKSANVESVEVNGANLWDEEWINTYIDRASGIERASDNCISSKNYNEIEPNQTYYLSVDSATTAYYVGIILYDSDKKYIDGIWNSNRTVTTPSNARFFKLTTMGSAYVYGGTYKNDIALVKGTSGSYSPYHHESIPFPTIELNSAGNVHDEIDFENGKFIQRVERVDLGSLNWTYYNNENYIGFASSYIAKSKEMFKWIIANAYVRNSLGNYTITKISDKSCGFIFNKAFIIRDDAFTDADSFKNSINGVILYYELAEPIITDISDIIEPFEVVDGGSITYHQTDETKHMPVPNKVEYLRKLSEVTA